MNPPKPPLVKGGYESPQPPLVKGEYESTQSSLVKGDLGILLAQVLNKPRSFLYAHPELELTPEQERKYKELMRRRKAGEPVAYILGKKEFWSLELDVNTSVLIPRPETELLVGAALAAALKNFSRDKIQVADLGTGSGAVALAIASERPNWEIVATDYNAVVLDVAKGNAQKLAIENITFIQGNWCDPLANNAYDLIVANPPYVAADDPEFQYNKYESSEALIAADNGLADIKKIIIQAKSKLNKNGILMLEHGYNQGSDVRQLLADHGYVNIVTHKDLAGLERVCVGVG